MKVKKKIKYNPGIKYSLHTTYTDCRDIFFSFTNLISRKKKVELCSIYKTFLTENISVTGVTYTKK